MSLYLTGINFKNKSKQEKQTKLEGSYSSNMYHKNKSNLKQKKNSMEKTNYNNKTNNTKDEKLDFSTEENLNNFKNQLKY